MSKFKVGDNVIHIGESDFGLIKNKQYIVRDVYSDYYLSLYGENTGWYLGDFFEIVPLAKDHLVSIELTHEQLLILYSLVASTTRSYTTDVYYTLKGLLEKIHGRNMLLPENLRPPAYVLNCEGIEKMKNFVKSFFPEPKFEQQLEYDKLQEQIKLLQQQAEKLNPSRSNSL